MYQAIENFSNQESTLAGKISENFYQQLERLSNTIISLQYNRDKLLSFRVSEVSLAGILSQGSEDKNLAIQCQIRGNTYKLTREHIEQLSNRECRELFQHLGITKTNLFKNN
jgi:hypothetical protein